MSIGFPVNKEDRYICQKELPYAKLWHMKGYDACAWKYSVCKNIYT